MEWIDKTVDDCSHIYSDGRNVPSLFETDEDKIKALNLLAITALEANVVLLMEVAMTTHFHCVVAGSQKNRWLFKREMDRKLEVRRSWLGVKTRINVRKDDISTENELKDKIMYDFRNPVAAGYGRMPWHYVGGPGDIFFSDHIARISSGRPIRDLRVTERRALFHTRIELPAGWTYWPNGLIVPDCYIDYQRLERLFKSPKGMMAFLYQSKEKEAKEDAICAREFILDMGEKELRHEAKRLSRSLFGEEYVARLSDKERINIAQRMWASRSTFSVSALSRATHLDKHLLEMILLPQS
ncbi:MAG: hypothetical protein IJK05_02375 [Bacteroidales bacterium]|nr:hypothetical protein [Bacteroidales bacterium]